VKVLWIALANLRRMFRARANIFFVFVFPMVLILVLGATFGGAGCAGTRYTIRPFASALGQP